MGDDKPCQSCFPRSVSSYYNKWLQVNLKSHSVIFPTHVPSMITPVIVTALSMPSAILCGHSFFDFITPLTSPTVFLWCTSGPTYSNKLIKTWLFSMHICTKSIKYDVLIIFESLCTLFIVSALYILHCVNMRFFSCALSVFYMLLI